LFAVYPYIKLHNLFEFNNNKRVYNSILSCTLKYLRFLLTMICKKKIFVLTILCFLNACTSPTAMLGPVYTFSSTGSIYQSGLSYGSNELLEKVTGKTAIENLKDLKLEKKKENIQKKTLESEDFYFLVKKKFENTHIKIKKIN